MCRNIRTLFNFEPPVTQEEVEAASLQFVRKITGFNKPSRANEVAFRSAVDQIAKISSQLLASLESSAAPKNRELEAAKAKARAAERYGALEPRQLAKARCARRAGETPASTGYRSSLFWLAPAPQRVSTDRD